MADSLETLKAELERFGQANDAATSERPRRMLNITRDTGVSRHHDIGMTPKTRRVLQAVLYEVFAIAFVGPVLSVIFDKPPVSTLGLAFVLSSIALGWNYVFNTIFERWESRQSVRGRSPARRFVHGIGFEGGLAVMLIPVMALWLDIPAVTAFLANLGLLAFFFVYAIAFTWTFDRVFGLPESAAKHRES